MNVILFDSVEFERRYNCSAYSVDSIPAEARQRPLLGATALALFLLFETLYVPVNWALWRHLQQSCYKIMFCIGLVDMPALCVNALLSGVFALQGAVFCSYPLLNLWAGFLGMFFWCAETHLAIVLAFNRLLSQACPSLCERLFNGGRTWLWAVGVLLYSLAFAWTEYPLVWSSLTFSWFFDPHIGYLTGTGRLFENRWDALEGTIVAVSMPICYLVYFVLLFRETGGGNSTEMDKVLAKIIFLQVFLVCMINSLESMIYVLMGLFPAIITPTLVLAGTFCWIGVHGVPPLIYLLVNKTLRRECRQLLGWGKNWVSASQAQQVRTEH